MVDEFPIFNLKDNQDISDMDTRRAIMSALEAKGQSFWGVVAVFSNSFVFEKDFGTLDKRDFSISDDGVVTIAEAGEIVRPVTEFVPVVANELKDENNKNNNQSEENKMAGEVTKETKEQVTALITNEKTEYKEEDREYLEGLEERTLKTLTSISDHQGEGEDESEKAPEGEKAPASAEGEGEKAPEDESKEGDPPPVTAAEYIAKAPPEIQGVLNEGVKLQAANRSELIESIKTNKDSSFSDAELQALSTDQLEKLAKMAAPVDYAMRGGPRPTANQEDSNLIPPMREIWPRKTA